MAAAAAQGGRSCTASRRSYLICPDLTLKTRASGCKRITGYFFIDMHSLRVLSQVVQTGETSETVTLERSLASVLTTSASVQVQAD